MPNRVAIITLHFVPNYGGLWQTYALQNALECLGCDVSIIDYRPPYILDGGPFWFPRSSWHCKANVVIAYLKLRRLRQRLTGDPIHNTFEHFQHKNLRLTDRVYTSVQELRRYPPDCNLLLCGSDQIWSPSLQHGLDPAYMLDFGSQRKVSYAASFGRPHFDARFESTASRLLCNLDAISVREESGISIVRHLTGQEAQCHCDPTLLFDDYPQAKRPAGLPDKYVFSYALRSSDTVTAVQDRVARHMGIPTVTVATAYGRFARADYVISPTPEEWLGCIKNAEYVVTNSYHGLIFSILFQKPFLDIAIGGGKEALNERALSLLRQLKLLDRFVSDLSDATILTAMSSSINASDVSGALADMRNRAMQYLKQQIAGGESPLLS